MFRISELRKKDVINLSSGGKLGFTRDIEIDLQAGRIEALILPEAGTRRGLFNRADELVIPWQAVRKLGLDVVLVEAQSFAEPKGKKRPPRAIDEGEDTYAVILRREAELEGAELRGSTPEEALWYRYREDKWRGIEDKS